MKITDHWKRVPQPPFAPGDFDMAVQGREQLAAAILACSGVPFARIRLIGKGTQYRFAHLTEARAELIAQHIRGCPREVFG